MGNGQFRTEEQFALQLLKNLFPASFSKSFICLDAPDLQDSQRGIGIEISRCMLPTQGQIDGFLKQYNGKNEDEIPSQKIEKLLSLGHKPFWYENKLRGVFSPRYSPAPNGLLSTASQKIDKLQQPVFKKFPSNRLFLFVWEQIGAYSHWQMHEFIQNINTLQDHKTYKYDVIYILDTYNNGYDLWICYLKTDYVRKVRYEGP